MLRVLLRLRLHVALLAAIVAAGAWAPAFARLVTGPPGHACHCEVKGGHADCACAVCFPELGQIETFGHASVSGKCGDEVPATGAHAMPAVGVASFLVVPPSGVVVTRPELLERPRSWRVPPPEEPPRVLVLTET